MGCGLLAFECNAAPNGLEDVFPRKKSLTGGIWGGVPYALHRLPADTAVNDMAQSTRGIDPVSSEL